MRNALSPIAATVAMTSYEEPNGPNASPTTYVFEITGGAEFVVVMTTPPDTVCASTRVSIHSVRLPPTLSMPKPVVTDVIAPPPCTRTRAQSPG